MGTWSGWSVRNGGNGRGAKFPLMGLMHVFVRTSNECVSIIVCIYIVHVNGSVAVAIYILMSCWYMYIWHVILKLSVPLA